MSLIKFKDSEKEYETLVYILYISSRFHISIHLIPLRFHSLPPFDTYKGSCGLNFWIRYSQDLLNIYKKKCDHDPLKLKFLRYRWTNGRQKAANSTLFLEMR